MFNKYTLYKKRLIIRVSPSTVNHQPSTVNHQGPAPARIHVHPLNILRTAIITVITAFLNPEHGNQKKAA